MWKRDAEEARFAALLEWRPERWPAEALAVLRATAAAVLRESGPVWAAEVQAAPVSALSGSGGESARTSHWRAGDAAAPASIAAALRLRRPRDQPVRHLDGRARLLAARKAPGKRSERRPIPPLLLDQERA